MENSSPLEKLTLWIYENKKIFNSAQYIDVMRLLSDAYKNKTDNPNSMENFDYARFRLHSENVDHNDEAEWSGTDEIAESSANESSDDESTYTGKYINHY
tara:strand:- start:4 stop:303 length:300 start_codon:yes stop_codon:yes gene_type:complete